MRPSPDCTSSAATPLPQGTVTDEQFCTLKLLYHLWRLDCAARSFPHECVDEVMLAANKARWTIGLTLEMQGVRDAVADVALLGHMTTDLSVELGIRTRWFNLASGKPLSILWDELPRGTKPPPVPSPPWMFGYPPALLLAQRRWWEAENPEKPAWWHEPIPEKWIHHVHVPRALMGEYLSALKDSKEVLAGAMSLLRSSKVVTENLTNLG